MASTRTAQEWGKTLADMETAKRNPRALVVELNAHMKRSLAWLGRRWGVSMITYDMVDGNAKWRTRRPDERPENDPQEWIKLAEQARSLAYSAQCLAEFADRQHAILRMQRAESSKVT